MKPLLLAGITLGAIAIADARGVHPPGPLHDWFEAQHSVRGAWCCDVSDGYILGDDDWDNQGPEGAYRVRVGTTWYPVPEEAARDPKGGPNPTGSASVWYVTTPNGVHIYCFAPGELY